MENNYKFNWKSKLKETLRENVVLIVFLIICLSCVSVSGMQWSFIFNELSSRLTRNLFLVLSLIIPVLAGMGLNFSIVIGAMAGQIAIIAVTHWGIVGVPGIALCFVIALPFALLFGWLTGIILNKTKGQEMITGMILGFFAAGLYQLVFLFLVGTVIPMNNPVMVLSTGVGIKNTIDLTGGIKYALTDIIKVPFVKTSIAVFGLITLNYIRIYFKNKKENRNFENATVLIKIIGLLIITGSFILISTQKTLINNVKVALVPTILIGLLCLLNIFITKTKMGQDFRTVGNDMHIASVSGINVNRVRIRAIVISTVLAAWGQIFFLENIGTLNTYGAHEQVGMFAIAALLVGGASVKKATIGQAIIGTTLFHTLFIVSPQAGKALFGNAQIGEYFRVFIAYGVIGVALALHAWKQMTGKKQ
ncbi:MAG: ABC transporter permease subunit [Filifactoraceae bacterium]